VVAFTLLASVLAVVAFGLAPAWRSTRLELNYTLQGSSGNRTTRRHGMSQMLVTAEAALVMVLVMSAGLLIRSFVKLTSVDPGFQAANRLTFDVELPRALESSAASHRATQAELRQHWHRQTLWFDELARRLRLLPGIEAVGASNAFPLTVDEGGWGAIIDGKQMPASTSMAMVIPGYFDAMGIPVVEGTDFSPATDSILGSKAVIVNQTMARLLFPGGGATGKHIQAPRCQSETSVVTAGDVNPFSDCVIVGIARDARFSLDSPAPPEFYYSLHQDPPDRVTYVLRANHDAGELVPIVRAAISNMTPADFGKAYFFNLQTMDQLVAQSVAAPRFRSWLISLFAGLALLLAAVGIYGVQAYAVSRRSHELGIRMALGARPAALFAMILGEAAGWTLLGVGIGLGAGLAIARLISGLLFEVSPWDAVTLAVSPLVLLGVALAAAYLPARRAMRVDPLVALRWE
jgi:putative ABC transport system permease protein